MKILYTGFEPFGGETRNPSFDALALLPDAIAGAEVLRLELPTAFDAAPKLLLAALERHAPDCAICVGQAGGRATVTPEYVAINYRNARIPDNTGFQPVDDPVLPGGPAAWFTRLPVRRIVERCREAGIPAAVSYTAGTYVCNALMYRLLAACDAQYPRLAAGFIHVPYSAEQAAAQANPAPSLPLPTIAEALRLAGEESLAGR